jgi:hypothetical protein
MLMDAESTWKLVARNRTLLIVIPLFTLVLASVGWNARQYQHEQDRRARIKADERSARAADALAKEYAKRAKLEKQVRDAKSSARIQQLQQEINDLTGVSERIWLRDQTTRTIPVITEDAEKTSDSP